MLTYTLQRLLWLIPTLLMMALVTFLVMHATPGSPLEEDDDPLAGARAQPGGRGLVRLWARLRRGRPHASRRMPTRPRAGWQLPKSP